MLGFCGRAEEINLQVDTFELESARWFSRDEIRNCPNDDGFRLRDGFDLAPTDRGLGRGRLALQSARVRGVDTKNTDLAAEETKFLHRQTDRCVIRMAVDIRIEHCRREGAADHIGFELGHVDAVRRKTAERLIQSCGDIADAENKVVTAGPASISRSIGSFAITRKRVVL